MRLLQLFPVCIAFFYLSCCSTDSSVGLLRDVEMQLGATSKTATEAVNTLIEMGLQALPIVFGESMNSEGFYGSCGNPPKYSSEFIDLPLADGALTEDGVFHPEKMPKEEAAMFFPTVADAKLYIAVTIGRQEPSGSLFSFCKLTQNEVPLDPEFVLNKLRDLYYSTPTPGANFSRETVDHILLEAGIDGIQ